MNNVAEGAKCFVAFSLSSSIALAVVGLVEVRYVEEEMLWLLQLVGCNV